LFVLGGASILKRWRRYLLQSRVSTPARAEPGVNLAVALLLAALLTGIGWVAVLPPWEGFDEEAHYSYIQEIADTKHVPVYRQSHVSSDIDAYRREGPFTNGGLSYRDLFSSPEHVAAAARLREPPERPREFAPGEGENWQLQHPPLYYLLMGPAYALTAGWSWINQLFALRALSYITAWAGLVIGITETFRYLAARRDQDATRFEPATVAAIMAGWPFFVPMFFPEMARVGNDSLSLLLAGVSWALLLRVLRSGDRPRDYALLGGMLGLGLLTKAFFVPIGAGIAIFLALRIYLLHRDGASAETRSRLIGLALTLVVAAILGAPWYLYKWLIYGAMSGSVDQILVDQSGGVVAGLEEKFSLYSLVRGIAGIVASFAWAGTWTLARLPEIFLGPLVLLPILVLGAYLVSLRHVPLSSPEWAPTFLVTPVVVGLVYHLLLRIVLVGAGVGTPGWYLHMLAPALGYAFAIGTAIVFRQPLLRRLGSALSIYAFGYFAVAAWAHLLLFSGCLVKVADTKRFGLAGDPQCMVDLPTVLSRLEVLGHPAVGLPLICTGLILAAVSMFFLYRVLTQESVPAGRQPVSPLTH
jgi:hypothetical protein